MLVRGKTAPRLYPVSTDDGWMSHGSQGGARKMYLTILRLAEKLLGATFCHQARVAGRAAEQDGGLLHTA
jgi:hypothetical protein